MPSLLSPLDAKEKQVYRYIRDYGPISKQAIMNMRQDYSSTTLTRLLNELQRLQLIEEIGYGESTGGRKPILYQIRADAGYVFGLDITRIVTRLALFDADLAIVAARQWRMTERTTSDRLLAEIARAIEEMMAEAGLSPTRVWGIGIGAVGPIDREQGVIVNPAYFPSEGWEQVRIREFFQEHCGLTAILDNGANTSLVGESRHIADPDRLQLFYVHLGVGWRSAVMAGGQLVYGAYDTEGAIGQMIIQFDGRPPLRQGGNFGSIESYVSIPALERQARSLLAQGRLSSLRPDPSVDGRVAFDQLVGALSSGDEMAREIFLQAGIHLGIGLANVINILHPDVVILGGPLISSNPVMLPEAIRVASEKTCFSSHYRPQFTKSRLGDEAAVTGAASLCLTTLLN